MINLDMVGRLRGDRLWVYGAETTPEFPPLLRRANESLGLQLDLRQVDARPASYTGSSDQITFHRKGIPVLHLFTGLHSQYHSVFDRVELINFTGMLKVIALTEGLVRELANHGLASRAVPK